MSQRALVSLSGGMDSSTVLAHALDSNRKCITYFCGYGSKHNCFEAIAARRVADHYGVEFVIVDLTEVGTHLKSDLLHSGGDIPEGHYEEESMRQTVVPGRNMIFASVLSGIAWSRECSEVWLGIHAGDHFIYPDCRPEFFEAMSRAVELGSDGKVKLVAPYLQKKKADILKHGLLMGVPYQHTRTCYKYQHTACGKCGSCQERLEAFKLNGVEDSLTYDSRELVSKR